MSMNPAVKQKWLAALRGGQYRQGKQFLRNGDAFCCLGVLCDLHAKETGGTWDRRQEGSQDYLGACYFLPEKVTLWAGLTEDNPFVDGASLVARNDAFGHDFTTIADLIEKEL